MKTFTELARRYQEAGHPDKRGERRPEKVAAAEVRRIENLRPHFRWVSLQDVTIRHCAEYGANRPFKRAADLDLQVLSNLFWFAVMEGAIPVNPTLGRAKHRKARDVLHCRERMPKDADEIHRVAGAMMKRRMTAAVGWQILFEAFCGCRTSEVLAFRTDSTKRGEPGFDDGEFLHLRRAKSGVLPFIKVDADMRELLTAHSAWKAKAWPDSVWYFPGISGALPLDRTSLSRALRNAGIRHITSHGLRAYFVTLQRSRGMSNEQVAALIGDKTSELIESTYGALPAVWSGGVPLTFMPQTERKAWE